MFDTAPMRLSLGRALTKPEKELVNWAQRIKAFHDE